MKPVFLLKPKFTPDTIVPAGTTIGVALAGVHEPKPPVGAKALGQGTSPLAWASRSAVAKGLPIRPS
jgi:hypothetical protein